MSAQEEEAAGESWAEGMRRLYLAAFRLESGIPEPPVITGESTPSYLLYGR